MTKLTAKTETREQILALIENGMLKVKVTPNARSNMLSVPNQTNIDCPVQIRVTETPEKGNANKAVIKLLATALRVPKSSVSIVRGEKFRNKLVQIDGIAVLPDSRGGSSNQSVRGLING